MTESASNQHRMHHLIWECFMGMTPASESAFADTELTLALSGTLDEIGHTPGATVADISRRTPKTQQAISQAAAKLEKMGLVQRRLGNGRGVGLYLTDAGEAARVESVAREQLIEDRLHEILGTEIYQELLTALEHSAPRFRGQDEPAVPLTKVSQP